MTDLKTDKSPPVPVEMQSGADGKAADAVPAPPTDDPQVAKLADKLGANA